MRMQSILVSVVVTLCVLSVANADLYQSSAVLHRQALDPTIDGLPSDVTYGPMLAEIVLLGWDAGDDYYAHLDEVLLTDGIITGVRWYGYYEHGRFAPGVGDTVDFSVAFLWNYSDDDPGGFIVNEVVPAIVSGSTEFNGRTIYEFVADPFPAVSISEVASVTLFDDYAIWLAIAESDPDSDVVNDPWLWSRRGEGGGRLAEAHDLTNPYFPYWLTYNYDYDGDFAFTLTGIVPLPGAVLLGSIGLSSSGWLLRRRRALH